MIDLSIVSLLSYASYLLDTYPKYYLDMSTTLSELGRQPYTARKFFIKYQEPDYIWY